MVALVIVVSYFNSTSNHNRLETRENLQIVVSYFNSTSNHNLTIQQKRSSLLFLISILHQTTTKNMPSLILMCCFLFQFYIKPQLYDCAVIPIPGCFLFQFYIKPQQVSVGNQTASSCFLFQFYIKPQPRAMANGVWWSCFLFQFYIKPQQQADDIVPKSVVSYFNSTSNHNLGYAIC